MAANSPSSQVPCLKSTAPAPLVFPSHRAIISLHKDDINKPDSSVGHKTTVLASNPLVGGKDNYKNLQ
jgi:hypothetical protein